MTYSFGFEKLDVWQSSRRMILKIYQITQEFPDEEKYGLTSQIRRSAVLLLQTLQKAQVEPAIKIRPIFINSLIVL